MAWFLTLDDVEVKGKTVIVRVDVNSPVDPATKRVQDNERIRAHAETLRELSGKGARVVVLAHQGRKGEPDFLPLQQHAELLSKHAGVDIRYVPDLLGGKAEGAVRSLRDGEVVLLENVRTLDEETVEADPETHSRGRLVSKLAPLAQLFVMDAFSVAHRAHASVVGFAPLLQTVAGRVMERELRALSEILEARKRIVFFMGGNKPEDCVAVAESILSRGKPEVRALLAAGLLGQLFLMARGVDLGEPSIQYIRKKGFDRLLDRVSKLDERLGDRVYPPVDVAYESDGGRVEASVEELPAPGPIMDIGERTGARFGELIRGAGADEAIVVKGPAGAYEKEAFRKGTRMVYEALADSKAFTLIGGGDSSTAIRLVGLRVEDFSYVSLGGGALIRYLSGKTLPGVEILKMWKR